MSARMAGCFTSLLLVLVLAHSAHGEVRRFSVPETGSPSIGPEKAEITIIEFLDYQ